MTDMDSQTQTQTRRIDLGAYEPGSGGAYVTEVARLAADAARHAMPANLALLNDGIGWNGTFGVLVKALCDDLLPEGPVEAVVLVLEPVFDHDGKHRADECVARHGDLVAHEGGSLRFADGLTVPTDESLIGVLL